MEHIDLYYDHYKDTFSILQRSLKKRDRLFVFLYIVLFISVLFRVNAIQSEEIIKSYFIEYLKLDMPYDFRIVQTFSWIVLLYFTANYFQTLTYIERQYKYIHKLENIIKLKINGFEREGFDYLHNYPLLLDVIHIFYNYVLPFLYVISICYLIYCEFLNKFLILKIINIIVGIFSMSLYILYIVFRIKKNK